MASKLRWSILAKDALGVRPGVLRRTRLLCDITMTERSGLELMADFNREHPDCRVIVWTGYYTYLVSRSRTVFAASPADPDFLPSPAILPDLLREAGRMLATA